MFESLSEKSIKIETCNRVLVTSLSSNAESTRGAIAKIHEPSFEQSPVKCDSNIQLKDSGETEIVLKNPSTNIPSHVPDNVRNKELVTRSSETRGNLTEDADNTSGNQHFKKLQNKTTLILFGITIIFLCANIPRGIVKCFHIYFQGRNVQKHFNYCARKELLHAPVVILIMGKLQCNR